MADKEDVLYEELKLDWGEVPHKWNQKITPKERHGKNNTRIGKIQKRSRSFK